MNEEAESYGKSSKPKKSNKTSKEVSEKPHIISGIEREKLKIIADKVKRLRIAKKISYEEFARNSEINRNTYFRLERSAETGENYTMALLLKVIRGLNISISDFFHDLK
jgi:DNA-binding XRE family transcriptional regulator